MTLIEYFKLQSKNLFRDYKSQTSYIGDGNTRYSYTPRYFDIESILSDFEDILVDCGWSEDKLSLMNIQHLFANMLRFKKWSDLLNASRAEQELAKLRWDNQDKIPLEDWEEHIASVKHENNCSFEPETELHLFKHCLSHYEGYGSPYPNYRLNQKFKRSPNNEKPRQVPKPSADVQITSLPLSKTDRAEFIDAANSVFESVVERIEPNNPALTRKLWDAENYVDNHLLSDDMLPISKDYALSLIDAFLVHHVIELATEADRLAA